MVGSAPPVEAVLHFMETPDITLSPPKAYTPQVDLIACREDSSHSPCNPAAKYGVIRIKV